MRKIYKLPLFLVFIFCLAATIVSAQQNDAQRAADERLIQRDIIHRQKIEEARKSVNSSEGISGAGIYTGGAYSRTGEYLPLSIAVEIPLTPEEQTKITPAKEDFEQFKEFLKKSNTGLAKILPDPNCGSEFVVDLNDPKCVEALPIPGRGAFFSFRVNRNFPFPYADIHFDDGKFKVGGKTELGIISKLGDKKIEDIELTSPEVKAVLKYKPAKIESVIRRQEEQIKRGFSANGFSYSNSAPAELNQTYIMRTIAFRHYEQFFNDRRIDAIIVFRAVKRETDGTLIILWRRLSKDGVSLVTR